MIVDTCHIEQLQEIAAAIGAITLSLDVTSPTSIEAFANDISGVDVLINNAGLASGLDPISTFNDRDWQTRFETNVLGLAQGYPSIIAKIAARHRWSSNQPLFARWI